MAATSLPGPDCSPATLTRDGVEYRIQPYAAAHCDGIVALLAAHWSAGVDEAWFRRTYVENPYLDHVPVFVAECDGDVVGVRPFTAYRFRAGGATELALLTRDTVVHPDHRRRGLFTAMTERALDHYERGRPAFAFSHANAHSLPGYRSLGWQTHGHRTTYARVQRADALLAAKTRERVGRILGSLAAPVARCYLAVRDRRRGRPAVAAVSEHERVPAETLAACYRQRPPTGPHVVRDEAFYRWRFASPEWQPNRTYVVRRDGDPVVALVTAESEAAVTARSVVDVVPRTGGEEWATAVGRALDAVIANAGDAAAVRATAPVFPTSLLADRGFLSGRRLPLSLLSSDSKLLTLGVRSLDGASARVGNHPVSAATTELWSVAH
jgi:GNAT superfamily N-acetyltransferase